MIAGAKTAPSGSALAPRNNDRRLMVENVMGSLPAVPH
jgi:hypothetical protein